MPRLILLLAVLATAYLLYRRVQALPPHKRRAELLRLAVIVAAVAAVLLTLAGKMHWIGAALTGLLVAARRALPLLLRLFPFLTQLRQQSATAQPAGGGGQSTVKTRTLAMHLEHDSGALSGEVLAGPWQDWRLDDMERAQLAELRRWCSAEDPEAVQLLDSYLEQRFPGEAPGDGDGDSEGAQADTQRDGTMTRSEALAVLGLGEDADREDIIAAHRRLMQKLHPDRGGNDYLAAKVNEAKDFLLR
ncbi:J domain-containing protein [Pseudohaliea rubra]|uniref:DnaJ domain protein n=1 Tax=Pseudohaliea rubra DSM 19751 TaxID=1265313 RepID=A0A095X393_9GAMM|nr:molecular chaperone DnaJ [Pseudohaliea rubra]KGE05359.1 DnaJ domain protein [Pseudohaliea rubra DSM 19751]